MVITAYPEAGISMTDSESLEQFMPTLRAAAETARLLAEAGLDFRPTDADLDTAAATARQAARDPSRLMLKPAITSLYKQTPAALLLTEHILEEFGHKVVQEAEQVRNLVTNKLVQETENPDPRVRLRALELLGKISDVGLFSDKREVTVTHQTTDDIKDRLREKLQKLISPVELTAPDVPIVDTTDIDDADIVEDDDEDEDLDEDE